MLHLERWCTGAARPSPPSCPSRISGSSNTWRTASTCYAIGGAMALLGVPDAQVEAVSYGKEKPAVEGHDERDALHEASGTRYRPCHDQRFARGIEEQAAHAADILDAVEFVEFLGFKGADYFAGRKVVLANDAEEVASEQRLAVR